MDDVLADATGKMIDLYEKEFGVRVARESMNHKEDREKFPDNHEAVYRFVFQKGFSSMAPEMPNLPTRPAGVKIAGQILVALHPLPSAVY